MRRASRHDHSERARETNDTASKAGASVAGLGGLFVAAHAKVILASVAHDRASNDGLGTVKEDVGRGHVESGLSIFASLEVAEVASVADFSQGTTMDHTLGVPVGASSFAALRQVAWRTRSKK